MVRTFTLEYWQDDGWYVGRLKEVPGVFSQGETMAELEENIRDAYKMMMETEVLPKLSMKPQEKEVDITL
jgi:predicted RNase H-like HicB family nuclease